jgi:hypothetical protein
MKFRIKRKTFSVYDDSDALLEMTDADILAEQEKNGSYRDVASGLTAGGVGGAVAGGLGYMALGSKGGGALKRLGRGAAAGLAAGALLGTGIGYMKKSAEDSRNQFYNDRLRYAKRMARRREAKNWKHNMAHRENYSF